jgi:hypothetical protein
MLIITLQGKLATGVLEIARILARRLHIDFIDREITAQVAARLHRDKQELMMKEILPGNFLERFSEVLSLSFGTGYGIPTGFLPSRDLLLSDEEYLEALKYSTRELVKNRSAIIYGRGCHLILKDYSNAFHVLVVAPLNIRMSELIEISGLSENLAKEEITRSDNSNRYFTRRFFGIDLEDPTQYDLVINTKHRDYDIAASTIFEACRLKGYSVP